MPAPPPANPMTIRLDEDDKRLLAELSEHLRLPQSEVVRQAIRQMGRERGLTHPHGTTLRAASA